MPRVPILKRVRHQDLQPSSATWRSGFWCHEGPVCGAPAAESAAPHQRGAVTDCDVDDARRHTCWMTGRPPRTATGFPDDSFDPLKRWREQQEAINRALDPMKRWREQQEAINRMMDPMRRFREEQEAIVRALSPLRSVRLDQASLLAHGGAISYAGDPLAAWRQQQMALRSVFGSLLQWRAGLADVLGIPAPTGEAVVEPPGDAISGITDLLDNDSVRALGEFQSGLVDQTVGPLLDAIVDEADDETLFRAAFTWATSQPWKVVYYYLEVLVKSFEWLASVGTATAAVAGDTPSTTLLLVFAFIVCTGELLLVLTRPGAPKADDA